MIGIAITTTPKRKHLLDLCISQIAKHTPERHQLFIHNDTEGKGVAYSKNECLRALQNCDDIFLFDDDCFPTQNGWHQLYTEREQNHLMYLSNWLIIKERAEVKGVRVFNNCAGVMMYLTKHAVAIVGAFNEKFGLYGYEHADYSIRVHKAGLTPLGAFLSPVGANKYLHSLDYNGAFNGIEATPNLSIHETQLAKATAIQHYSENPEIYIPL
jgi:hypothetical protein